VKKLTVADVERLASALDHAFRSVVELEQLLQSDPLNKRFDDLTSRALPLRKNALEITSQAYEQGWALPLLTTARALQPDNPQLRALWDSLPEAAAEPLDAVARRSDRPSLLCGRGAQWNEVCQVAPARQHHCVLVMGAVGQDALHFRDRIETWLASDPHRSIVVVHWATRPASRDAYFADLAAALQVPPPMLASTIAERLTVQNLVLLHDCLTVKFDDARLISYYTEWLPDLLKGSPNASNLKCVQPLEWPASVTMWRRFWRGRGTDSNSPESAAQLIKTLQERQSANLPVVGLDELVDLTNTEIGMFLKTSGLTVRQQALMRERLQQGPQMPAAIFDAIDANWNEVETIQ